MSRGFGKQTRTKEAHWPRKEDIPGPNQGEEGERIVVRVDPDTLRLYIRDKGTWFSFTGVKVISNGQSKQLLIFGYNAIITALSGATTTIDAFTLNGASNDQGYRTIRNGKVTGVSLQYEVATTGTGTFAATVQRNAVNESMSVFNTVTSGDKGISSTANSFSFVAGDTINVELELEETASSGTIEGDDVSILVEIET